MSLQLFRKFSPDRRIEALRIPNLERLCKSIFFLGGGVDPVVKTSCKSLPEIFGTLDSELFPGVPSRIFLGLATIFELDIAVSS